MDFPSICICVLIGLYLTATGCKVSHHSLQEQGERKQPQFLDLPLEIRHAVYRLIFAGAKRTFSTAIEPHCQPVPRSENLFILLTCKTILREATPVLVANSIFKLAIRRGPLGRVQDSYQQLQVPWTHSIRHLIIDAEMLSFLHRTNPCKHLGDVKTVKCTYNLIVRWAHTSRSTSEHDKEQEEEPYCSMDEYLSDLDMESIRDDAGTLNGLVPSQINNIVQARDVKFQLHELTAQMNEVFPRCQQLMELRFQLVEDGGLVFQATEGPNGERTDILLTQVDDFLTQICRVFLTEDGLWYVERQRCVGDWGCWEDVLDRTMAFYRGRDSRVEEIEEIEEEP